jgi:hypothetical protein
MGVVESRMVGEDGDLWSTHSDSVMVRVVLTFSNLQLYLLYGVY